MRVWHRSVLAAAFALLLAAPASATLLYAGTEDIDFSCAGTCTVVTSGGGTNYRSDWVREALSLVGSAAGPPTNAIGTPDFTASGTAWVHFQYNANGIGTTSDGQLLRFIDSAGNAAIIIRGTGTDQQVKISSRTAGGAFTDLGTCTAGSLPLGTLQQVDVKLTLAVAGEVTLYSGGTQFCTFSGDTTNGDGSTTIIRAEISHLANGATAYFSEVVVADADTRDKNYLAMYPTASGNQVQWTGANPCTTILNATAFADGTFVSSATNNQIEQCTVHNTIPTGAFNVDAVVMSARALRGTTGPQHFQFVTRTGGANYNSSDQAPTTSFGNFNNYLQATNPGTSNPWTISDITAAGFNIGLESTP